MQTQKTNNNMLVALCRGGATPTQCDIGDAAAATRRRRNAKTTPAQRQNNATDDYAISPKHHRRNAHTAQQP
eukprot:5252374-Lingulodinium_polyedra.AAC.1